MGARARPLGHADPGQVRIEQVQDRGPADGSTVVGWGEHGLDAAALLVDQRVDELGLFGQELD